MIMDARGTEPCPGYSQAGVKEAPETEGLSNQYVGRFDPREEIMERFRVVAAAALLFLAAATPAFAQSDGLVGSWTLVSSVVEQGGNRIEPFGPNPKGRLIFDANGRYAAMIARPGLPKLAADNRTTATPEEAKAIVAGSIAHFGSYAVNEADKTITFRIETSTHPNWDATEQKRTFAISGDELKYVGVSAVLGGASATLTWKRAR